MTEPTMERTDRADFQATTDPACMESADRGEVELLGYGELYSLWERQQWAVQDIDFTQDRIDWHERIPPEERYQRMYGLSSFFIGEQRVAAELGPMMRAAPEEDMRIFLCTQIADEARHVQFFDRFYSEVGVLESDNLQRPPGRDQRAPQRRTSRRCSTRCWPAGSTAWPREPEDLETLVEAITLYHMVIEGMLALTGQHFIIEYNESMGTLPGFVEGFNNVARDEHRHVAFGARFLRDMAAARRALRGGHHPDARGVRPGRGRRAPAAVVRRGRGGGDLRLHDGRDAGVCDEGARAAAEGNRARAGRLAG